MDWGSPEFVIAIIAMSTIGWIVNNWIRAKHGYSLEDEWGGKTDKADTGQAKAMQEQNQKLLQTMEKMQDRMIVLERIVTDKGYTVAEVVTNIKQDLLSQIKKRQARRRVKRTGNLRRPPACISMRRCWMRCAHAVWVWLI